MRTATSFIAWTLAVAAQLPGSAAAASPHQHGTARLNIALEVQTLSIEFESPLENLIGFERAPRTEAERRSANAAVATLKAGDKLFRIDPAAQCTLAGVEMNSAALQIGKADAKADEGHADLDASYRFSCKGQAPSFVEIGLFDMFKGMTRIDVQVVTARGQSMTTLKRPSRRVRLTR